MSIELIDGKPIKAYPEFLKPLLESYLVTKTFTPNAIKDVYSLMVEKGVKEKIFTVNTETVTLKSSDLNNPLTQIFNWVKTEKFLIPKSLYDLEEIPVQFLDKFLEQVEEHWALKKRDKVVPELLALSDTVRAVRFTPPAVEEFGGLSPEAVLALLRSILNKPVFDLYDSEDEFELQDEIVNRTGDSAKPGVKFRNYRKYIATVPLVSLRGSKKVALKGTILNNAGLVAGMGGAVTGSFLLNPTLGSVAVVSSVFVTLGTVISWFVNKNTSGAFVASLTPEGEFLYTNLVAWERYKIKVDAKAKYVSSLPKKPNLSYAYGKKKRWC